MINFKVSIVTASYNSEQTIDDTLNSVLSQHYSNYEYIIIDGGSTDKTIDIIKSYQSLFEGRLKWISERDNGIYDAWNKGLKLVTGQWVCFIGSDDILCSDALTHYIAKINENEDFNFISSKVELINSKNERTGVCGKAWSSKMKTYCTIAHVGSFHRTDLFVNYGNYSTKYKICSDYEFLLRNYTRIIPGFIDKVTARMSNAGISNSIPDLVFKETYMIKKSCGFSCNYLNYLFLVRTIWAYKVKRLINLSGGFSLLKRMILIFNILCLLFFK